MAEDSLRTRIRANASGIVATIVTGTWLALLMLNFPSEIWLAVMLFGYIAVVPVVSMLFDEEEEVAKPDTAPTEATDSESENALERLRRRYAEGELTDEQFERKLDRLLETETLEDVEDTRTHQPTDGETAAGDRIAERE